jgi:D-alanine-D-alanine ligase
VKQKNVLLLCGGAGPEHEVSLVSVQHIKACLKTFPYVNLRTIEMHSNGLWIGEDGKKYLLDAQAYLRSFEQDGEPGLKIDVAIPCIHGHPGETGDIQSYFEMINLPYLGCNSETSKLCFNKITTKLWATALGVANTPYEFITEENEESYARLRAFQKQHGDIVIKASNQGSSVGCYLVEKDKDPVSTVKQAFALSPFVLIEKRMKPRELEVSAYELDGKLHISYPGEIICPSSFYSYEEKYSSISKTTTVIRAADLTDQQINTITEYSIKLFKGLKLRHLSRIDYFLDQGIIYLNEINTFPGLTPISMFPKMMEANGHRFEAFLSQHINNL